MVSAPKPPAASTASSMKGWLKIMVAEIEAAPKRDRLYPYALGRCAVSQGAGCHCRRMPGGVMVAP
jgi:hypothetical protein